MKLIHLFFSILVCLLLWIVSPLLAFLIEKQTATLTPALKWSIYSNIGDSFGIINTFFSGAAFIGVVFALFIQHRDSEESTKRQAELTTHLSEQVALQSKLLSAQLLRDRFSAYREACQPISQAVLDEFKMLPEEWMDYQTYTTQYQGDDNKIRRYIYLSYQYEYLAFTYVGPSLGLEDPLGPDWIRLWTADLLKILEFSDVHTQYRSYYPKYADLVESLQ
jgi:hypothetical protein